MALGQDGSKKAAGKRRKGLQKDWLTVEEASEDSENSKTVETLLLASLVP